MSRTSFVLAALAATASPALCQVLPKEWADDLHWRSIGPSNMGGRIVAFAVYEAKPTTWWAATASGGLLKTTNNGVTFEHQFDREDVVSIGHVAVSQSNPDVVWVGTGEAHPRNSVSYGNGVYKLDRRRQDLAAHGARRDSFQIGRIAIHPTNPDIVYVGALGRLYGPEPRARSLQDDRRWQDLATSVLFVDDQHRRHRHRHAPGTIRRRSIVATYERARDGFDTNDPAKRWGPGGGLWKTTDGGINWTADQERPAELPEIGRIGVDYYRKDPNVLMAIVESEKIAKQPEDAPYHGASAALRPTPA